MWGKVATVVGCLLTLGVVLRVLMPKAPAPSDAMSLGQRTHQQQRWNQQRKQALKLRAPQYKNTVMPDGMCNIKADDGLPAAFPSTEFPAVIPMAINPNYGGHIVVHGRDGKLYHKYQQSKGSGGNWTDWKCLTPDLTKIPCSSFPKCNGYDNNPVIVVQPNGAGNVSFGTPGTLVVFVRQMDDLDIHEMHLTDPKDPESWTPMRAPCCLCNFPPCVDKNQTRCGTEANCDNKGVDCGDAAHQPSSPKYWSTQPSFPTSELNVVPDDQGKLQVFFRNFDGQLYMTRQGTSGDANSKYDPPVLYGTNALVE